MTDLKPGENHPAAHDAMRWIKSHSPADLAMWRESFASCALSGNRGAEICGDTLERILSGLPVGERYVLGLAWTMRGDEIRPSKSMVKRVQKLERKDD